MPKILTSSAISRKTEYAYFFFYSFVRTSYIRRLTAAKKTPKPVQLSTAAELFLGALAGALAQIFTIPVSVIATRQQIGRSSSYRGSSRNLTGTDSGSEGEGEEDSYDESFLSVGRSIIREEGIAGLWLGIKPGLVLTVNPAITYGLFERVKGLLILAKMKAGAGGVEEGKLNPGLAFVVGALSKTLATVVRLIYSSFTTLLSLLFYSVQRQFLFSCKNQVPGLLIQSNHVIMYI